MTIAQQLARFAVRAGWDDVPNEVHSALKVLVLDSLGCAIGAVGVPGPVQGVRAMVEEVGGNPVSTMIGGGRTSPDRAALHNGAAVRYLDFNDTFLAYREACHPSDNLAPVLAASEHAGQSGTGFLAALAVAYQVHCTLTERAPVRDRGFDHTTQGVYAVAAGVARALELDEEQATNAVCIAGTPFNALRVTRTGQLSHWKGLAYPMAASNGTQAVYLSRHGITGPAEVFEGKKGFMDSIAGPFEIEWEDGQFDRISQVLIKRYNAEAHSQSAIQGLLEMQAAHAFSAEDVETMDVHVFDACYNIIGGGDEGSKHDVRTKETADHSLPYMLAVALLDGTVMPPQYAPRRIASADVQELLARIHVHEDATLTARFPKEMAVRLDVRLRDGSTLRREQADFEGFPSRPMSWQRAQEKFRFLADPHGTPSVIQEIIDVVADLDQVESVRSLTELLGAVRAASLGS